MENLSLLLHDREIITENPSFIMGIINANNNSFWKESRFTGKKAINQALKMIDEGADILDIGAESTRPGSSYISEKEELKALLPLIKQIRKHSNIPISIDTRKMSVMKACFEEGANILNDISALEDDENMASFAANAKIPVVLMHKKGSPSTMQTNPQYDDVISEVSNYLLKRSEYAISKGIAPEKIILDAGIGFGKNLNHNKKLIISSSKILQNVQNGLEYNNKILTNNKNIPSHIIMALSRKSCIGELTSKKVDERLAGTLAANLLAVENGATILRVHDVKETRDMLLVYRGLHG